MLQRPRSSRARTVPVTLLFQGSSQVLALTAVERHKVQTVAVWHDQESAVGRVHEARSQVVAAGWLYNRAARSAAIHDYPPPGRIVS